MAHHQEAQVGFDPIPHRPSRGAAGSGGGSGGPAPEGRCQIGSLDRNGFPPDLATEKCAIADLPAI